MRKREKSNVRRFEVVKVILDNNREIEKTSYERLLNIEVLYEAKDRKVSKLEKQNGILVKLNERYQNGELISITIEAISPKDVICSKKKSRSPQKIIFEIFN